MLRSWVRTLVVRARLAASGVLLLASGVARAEVILNEVLYDPAGADEGGEWVEVWNPDPFPRSLAGVSIEAADGSRPDVWVPVYRGAPGDTIPPRAAFLVRATALSAPLQNGPDAVRLTRDGVLLDLLGYGALDAPSLYAGAPAPDAASGHSLARRVDGEGDGRNEDDWEEEPNPTPGRANHPDERLSLVPALTLDPVVSWPGESVRVRTRVANRGRLSIAGPRWRVAAEWDEDSEAGAPGGAPPIALAQGVPLAPGESVAVELRFEAPAAGPFRVRVHADAAEGTPDPDAFADTLSVAGRSLASPAVVNEVAFRDAGAGEWVEVWLREPVSDIGEFAIADGASAPRPIARGDTPRPVATGSLLVVAQDPRAVRERYGLDSSAVLGIAGGWPALNDTDGPDGFADAVRLTSADGTPSDVILYDARAVTRAGSLERLSPDLPGHLPGTFGECVDPARATPGRPNSLHAPDRSLAPRGALLLASGRILRRDPGAPPLLLRLTPEARGRSLVVQVRDLLGRPVRTLVFGQRFAGDAALAWDGRGADGAWVRPGLYVIAAEAAGDGGAPRRTAIPIAVSAAAGAAP